MNHYGTQTKRNGYRAIEWSNYVLVAIILGLLLLIPAQGFAGSGNEFLMSCKAFLKLGEGNKVTTETDLTGSVVCGAYLEGFLDSKAIEMAKDTDRLYCPPEGVTMGQIARIVIKYLEDHPEKLHENKRMAVGISLIQAFPCNK